MRCHAFRAVTTKNVVTSKHVTVQKLEYSIYIRGRNRTGERDKREREREGWRGRVRKGERGTGRGREGGREGEGNTGESVSVKESQHNRDND